MQNEKNWNSATRKELPFVDVLIVGAGLSGLTTALKILKKDESLKLRIIEANNEIGGKLAHSFIGEIGAKWISTDQEHMCKLLKLLDIPLQQKVKTTTKLSRCWDIDCGVTATLAKFELMRYVRELELRMPYFQPQGLRRSQQGESMYAHICKSLFFTKSRKFMFNIVLLVSGAESQDISYPEFMTICASCGGLSQIIDIYLLCPDTLLEVPSKALLKALLQALDGVEILALHKVVQVRHAKDYTEVFDSQLCHHKASVVVLAIPWSDIQQIYIASSLPQNYEPPLCVLLKMPNYCVTSILAKYDTSHWQNAGYSGSFMCSEPFMFGHEYRAHVFSCQIIHHQNVENIKLKAMQTLAQHFGSGMLTPDACYHRTYKLSFFNNLSFRNPWKRIIWSSSSVSATCYRGCLAGAVQSGLWAAEQAMLVVRPQIVSWRDEAEIRCKTNTAYCTSWLALWESTLNLYNVTFYGLVISGVFGAWKFANANHLFQNIL